MLYLMEYHPYRKYDLTLKMKVLHYYFCPDSWHRYSAIKWEITSSELCVTSEEVICVQKLKSTASNVNDERIKTE